MKGTNQLESLETRIRAIRVFISSTFSDMQEEREELVKHVFPKLRKTCEERGVTWGEVDLRWGITDEQSKKGKVLPICLKEIENCRPYFIGILGERYGWIPETIDDNLIALEPWLKEYKKKSVTELEIIHGVLRNPKMASQAFFYFRNSSYIEKLPKNIIRSDFVSEDEISRKKLTELKERIRNSGLPFHDNYKDPKELGQLVLKDITSVIDKLFPPEEQPNDLDREAAEHEAFAASRRGVYIGRKEYFDRLDEHVKGNGPPIVLTGESGCGKSALLANWAHQYRKKHSKDLLLMHFIGASSYSADWTEMVRRFMGEFKRRFGIEDDIPKDPEELKTAFPNWLNLVSAKVPTKRRIILIIDALNQLEEIDGAQRLPWLPVILPGNIKLILSTLPGPSLEEIETRKWPLLNIQQLEIDECKRFIKKYLAQYRKEISAKLAQKIASAPQASNPLFLRALLEELRLYGDHKTLNECVEYYLEVTTIDGLFERILARYEHDYEHERPGLVRAAFSLIWGARRGLAESELLDMLGSDGQQLPHVYWSELHLATESSLVSRSGLIDFFHEYMRMAVKNRYLEKEEERRAVHARLADYFERMDLNNRKITELPWQLAQGESWKRLYDLLGDLPFFNRALKNNEYKIISYWAMIEKNSEYRRIDAYKPVLDDPEHFIDYVWTVASVIRDSGHLTEALSLYECSAKYHEKKGDKLDLATDLNNIGFILNELGELDKALECYRKALKIDEELDNQRKMTTRLNNIGAIYHQRGQLDEAMICYKKALTIGEKLNDLPGIALCLNNISQILQGQGRLDEALEHLQKAMKIHKEINDSRGVAVGLNNIATIIHDLGQQDRALEYFQEALKIDEELNNLTHMTLDLINIGQVYFVRHQFDKALDCFQKSLKINEEQNIPRGIAYSLNSIGQIYSRQDRLDEALVYFQKALKINEKLDDPRSMSSNLNNIGFTYAFQGRGDEALEYFQKALEIDKKLDDPEGMASTMSNMGFILEIQKQYSIAIELFQKSLELYLQLENPDKIKDSYFNLIRCLQHSGAQIKALQYSNEFIDLMVTMGMKNPDVYKKTAKLILEKTNTTEILKILTKDGIDENAAKEIIDYIKNLYGIESSE